jgi:hypothetical protein
LSLIQDPLTSNPERAEAHGLLGRIYKQLYVNSTARPIPDRVKADLQRSLDEYTKAYAANPQEYIWQGVNMIALLARAERDSVVLTGASDFKELARAILKVLSDREEKAIEELPAWDLATQMEAQVALGEYDQAYKTAIVYVDSGDADAFEVASTLRQLQEVWRLNNSDPPGSQLIPILRSAQLHNEGGGITVPLQEARQDLQKKFTPDGLKSVKWYRDGLIRGQSVCRIEWTDGRGNGTGWLVNSSDFFPENPNRLLVLTNTHVVNPDYPGAIPPPNAWLNFQLLEKRIQMKSIFWSSPVNDLDATFLDFDDELTGAVALAVFANPMRMTDPPDPGPRLYIIGHPGGRDLEFSLNDNRLIACNAVKLHYRTPTEEGSSGSPVFDPIGWQIVGLHHAGQKSMPKLNGPVGEVYEANEGLAILAIQQRTRGIA